jgi:hypothetical protein
VPRGAFKKRSGDVTNELAACSNALLKVERPDFKDTFFAMRFSVQTTNECAAT